MVFALGGFAYLSNLFANLIRSNSFVQIIGDALNNNYPHPIIAREGWPFLAIAVVEIGRAHV